MSVATTEVRLDGHSLRVRSLNTLVIGSGAAGLNAALQLHRRGQRDIAIVTEQWGAGTSNNAGSDKQTYYKLSLAGRRPDCARQMAEDLFRGGSMHGDVALCEAQHSAQAFFNLVELGVPFPQTRCGAYAGYRTDHDPYGRGTSAGPLTSRMMCESLGKAVQSAGIPVFDRHVAIALLTTAIDSEKHACGAVAIDLSRIEDGAFGFVLFNAVNVVLATGGPGAMYAASVYPESQTGSMGMALAIGAVANNLTESQFGLASIRPRWNLSGSYQQVIPRYVSCDANGGDEREFLADGFSDLRALATAVFRKGYEWPFDCEKVASGGSSLIDLLVYRETALRGRRVFLDFARNPSGGGPSGDFALDLLPDEAAAYLRRSQAWRQTPIERLAAMNPPAIDFFRSHGVDLSQDRLEIAVCAQHSNGGLRGNVWWESNIRHLFPVGEINGSHGVRRPGGAALNAGQVGSLRAAMYIAARYAAPHPRSETFVAACEDQLRNCLAFARRVTTQRSDGSLYADAAIREIQGRMSTQAAHVRSAAGVEEAAGDAWRLVRRLSRELAVTELSELPTAYRAADLALAHAVYLEAIKEYLDQGGQSRGSAIVLTPEGQTPCPHAPDDWRFKTNEPGAPVDRRILEISLNDDGGACKRWVDIRPIPEEDDWFETVWKDSLNDRIIR